MVTFITAVTAALLACWFRYACRLILLSGRGRHSAVIWENARKLHLHEIAPRLESPMDRAELLPIAQTVHADYRMVTYMLQNGADFRPFGTASLECKMLYLYYRALQLIFHVSSPFRNTTAHSQLCQMTRVVNHLAGRMMRRPEAVN